MKKLEYITPETEIILLKEEDIITSSGWSNTGHAGIGGNSGSGGWKSEDIWDSPDRR